MADDGFAQQLVLGTEPAVHGARRQPGLAHDVADAGPLVTLPGEHAAGSVEQLLTQRIVGHPRSPLRHAWLGQE